MNKTQLSKLTATRVEMDDEGIDVYYHDTRVFSYSGTRDKIFLDNAGFITNTTASRMNQAAREFGFEFKVRIENHKMICDMPDGSWGFVDPSLSFIAEPDLD